MFAQESVMKNKTILDKKSKKLAKTQRRGNKKSIKQDFIQPQQSTRTVLNDNKFSYNLAGPKKNSDLIILNGPPIQDNIIDRVRRG